MRTKYSLLVRNPWESASSIPAPSSLRPSPIPAASPLPTAPSHGPAPFSLQCPAPGRAFPGSWGSSGNAPHALGEASCCCGAARVIPEPAQCWGHWSRAGTGGVPAQAGTGEPHPSEPAGLGGSTIPRAGNTSHELGIPMESRGTGGMSPRHCDITWVSGSPDLATPVLGGSLWAGPGPEGSVSPAPGRPWQSHLWGLGGHRMGLQGWSARGACREAVPR